MTQLNPQFVAQVTKIREVLDTLDYFQLLRLPYDAIDDEVREGYHQQARTFHPDRYMHLGVDDLVRDLTVITKRIVEAYVVLREPSQRAHYLEGIQGDDRAANLRFQEAQQDDAKERAEGSTQQGRKLIVEATASYDRGDVTGAVQTLKTALLYEKDNQGLENMLAEWTEELK